MIPGPRQESQDVSPGGLALSQARVIFIPGAWQNPLDYHGIIACIDSRKTGLSAEVLDLPSSRPEMKEKDDLEVLAQALLHENTPAHLVAASRGGALAVRASYEDTLSSHISGITLVNVGGPPVLRQPIALNYQEDSRHTPLFFQGIRDLGNGWTTFDPEIAKEVFYNCTPATLQKETIGRMRHQRTPRREEIPLAAVPSSITLDVVCSRNDRVYNSAIAHERRKLWLGDRPSNEEILEGDHSIHVSQPEELAAYVIQSVQHALLETRKHLRQQ